MSEQNLSENEYEEELQQLMRIMTSKELEKHMNSESCDPGLKEYFSSRQQL